MSIMIVRAARNAGMLTLNNQETLPIFFAWQTPDAYSEYVLRLVFEFKIRLNSATLRQRNGHGALKYPVCL